MSTPLSAAPVGQRCIYILDDDPDLCRLVSGTLREFGF